MDDYWATEEEAREQREREITEEYETWFKMNADKFPAIENVKGE